MNIKTKLIKVIPYNPDWPRMFEEQAALIKQVLGNHCLEVHHIGSTSIVGLNARRDIDILCIVDQLSSSLALQNSGYTFKGEINIPLRYYFSKNTVLLKVNLHVVENDHGFIALNLCFRDYLRAHEDECLAYAKLKEQILQDPASYEKANPQFTGYHLRKDQFIKSILEKAGFDGFSVNFCMHDNEWENYHRIREGQIFKPIGVVYNRSHPSITAGNNYHFVLYKGRNIVSVAHVELLNDTEAALRSLATDETYKRQGCATYMLKFLEKWAGYQGRNIIKMHAGLRAEHFYRKFGYVNMVFDDSCICAVGDYVNLGKGL